MIVNIGAPRTTSAPLVIVNIGTPKDNIGARWQVDIGAGHVSIAMAPLWTVKGGAAWICQHLSITTLEERRGEKTTDVSQLATSQATKSDEEDIDYKSVRETENICSCGLCDDIKSTPWPGSEETFQHICCQQTDRWKDTVS